MEKNASNCFGKWKERKQKEMRKERKEMKQMNRKAIKKEERRNQLMGNND